MTDDINEVAKAIKHCLDIKDFANNATLAKAAIETLKSLGWTPPAEREAIRAAALKKASDHLLKHGWIGRTQQDILALATMPPDYVVVKLDDWIKATKPILIDMDDDCEG
jgi:hypothetical protein